jgi:hypothetical protein
MSQSQSHDTLHGIAAKLISCAGVIVIFKKDALQETIDKQASAIEQNGGSVRMFDNTGFLKVRNAVLDLRTYLSLIMHNQGFSAEIPDPYLSMLQSSLQGGNSPIKYIGKADAI